MKIKDIITTIVFALFLGSFSLFCMLKAPGEMSESERRPLAQMPAFNNETILNSSFMTGFEEYTTDQFPFRV